MKRKLCILMAVLMAATMLPACSKKEEPKKETKVEKEEPKVEEEPEEEIPANQNLLTGLRNAAGIFEPATSKDDADVNKLSDSAVFINK